jgi:hypothetical protein
MMQASVRDVCPREREKFDAPERAQRFQVIVATACAGEVDSPYVAGVVQFNVRAEVLERSDCHRFRWRPGGRRVTDSLCTSGRFWIVLRAAARPEPEGKTDNAANNLYPSEHDSSLPVQAIRVSER